MLDPSRLRSSVLLTTLLALGGAAACRGTTLYGIQLQEQVVWGPFNSSLDYDSGALPQTSLAHDLGGSGAGGEATTEGTIGGGLIHGLADAADISNLTQATLSGFWSDAVTLGGLPAGSTVVLRVTDSLISSIVNDATVSSLLKIFAGGNESDLGLVNSAANPHSGIQGVSMDVTCTVGALACFQFTEELTLHAIADANGLTATANALDTNQVFIDVLTPGATITSASGVTYDSTAPEPSTAGPVLAVLAGLGLVASRKRSVQFIRRASR